MKKLVLAVIMAMVFAPAIVFAWSPNFYPATEAEMRAVTCRNGGFSNLDFVVISRHDDWAGFQTEVRPLQPDIGPDRGYVEHIRVQAGTELAGMFEVGSTVTHLHEVGYHVETGPSVLYHKAGITTFGGSSMTSYGGDWYVQSH